MLPAAEFRALAAEGSILRGLNHEPVLASGNHVHLAGETGYPERMTFTQPSVRVHRGTASV